MAKHSVQRKRKKRGNGFSFGRAVVLFLCFIGVSFGLYLSVRSNCVLRG